jgi:hypothetical protein
MAYPVPCRHSARSEESPHFALGGTGRSYSESAVVVREVCFTADSRRCLLIEPIPSATSNEFYLPTYVTCQTEREPSSVTNGLPSFAMASSTPPMHHGHADGSYEDFLTGFVTKDGEVCAGEVFRVAIS